jgi:F-type H+-transporting ATPase subunit epsilon
MPIHCEIVSQDRIVFTGDVDIVVVPGSEGVMGILPNHSPVLGTMTDGVITTRNNNQEQHFTVAGGIVEVQPDQVTILADAAENVLEINIARAEEARKRAEASLSSVASVTKDEYLAAESALRRSRIRLDAARRYGQQHTGSYQPPE